MNKTTRLVAIVFVGIAAIFGIARFGFGLFAVEVNASTVMNDDAAVALMKANGPAIGALTKMAKGTIAFDAVAAEAAKQVLIVNAQAIPAAFKEPFAREKTLPVIWENYEDFAAKTKALEDAIAALDVTSTDTIGAGLAAVGGACRACHQVYLYPAKS